MFAREILMICRAVLFNGPNKTNIFFWSENIMVENKFELIFNIGLFLQSNTINLIPYVQ